MTVLTPVSANASASIARVAAVAKSTPPPGFSDLVSKLDDAVRRRSLEATPADELQRVAGDEETRAPGRSARVRGDGISGGLERGSERCPAGHDIVAEHRSQRVVAHESCVQQMQIGADEANHRHELFTRHDRGAARTTNGAPSLRASRSTPRAPRRLLFLDATGTDRESWLALHRHALLLQYLDSAFDSLVADVDAGAGDHGPTIALVLTGRYRIALPESLRERGAYRELNAGPAIAA